ncbi:head GIN domain-containing protein [Saccharicrinis sp. 156]|uniref:head GIN domain-containing protein n=1 Tax=Saccharicrinis sp. 156 TaxID=3417574 RepID=UPI003D32E351
MARKKVILSVFTLLVGVSLLAKSGTNEREVREVAKFNSITANSGLDVYIVQGSECSVEVEASKSQIHRIVTEVKGGTLHVYVKGNFRWNLKDVRKVYVSAPEFTNITANGGADIRGNSVIKSGHLNVKSNGGADIYLSVDTKSLILNCSGGADIMVEGTTEQLTASASGGADINAKKLKAKYVTASASGGGDIDVFASESITAKASGGGDVNYMGSPKKKNISESGGGDVSGY